MSRLAEKTLNKWYPRILTLGAIIGLVASFWQVVERITMLKDPGAALSCNLNPVIDCGSVLSNRWAALFGFPNALIGIVMFTILMTFGLAMLAGVKARDWFWKAFGVVALILILFSVWFFGMSLYVIGKVCLFCIFIWTVSVPIFLYGIDWLVANKHLGEPKFLKALRRYHTESVVLIYMLALALYFYRFRTYYF